jgi:hypothetical protein
LNSLTSLLLRTSSLLLSGVIAGLIASAVLFSIFHTANDTRVEPPDHQILMQRCIDRVVQTVVPAKLSPGLYERFWRLCGNQIFNGLYLEDFTIRRNKFIRQELDERINLWLVVVITISGVALAAVQLFLSYKLAVQGRSEMAKDSELAIEAGKISLRSSITGALILALSFLFFMVYVYYIYSIREISYQSPTNLQAPTENQIENQSRPISTSPQPTNTAP